MASWKRHRSREPLQSTQHDGLNIARYRPVSGSASCTYHCIGAMMAMRGCSACVLAAFACSPWLRNWRCISRTGSSIYADQTSIQIGFDSHKLPSAQSCVRVSIAWQVRRRRVFRKVNIDLIVLILRRLLIHFNKFSLFLKVHFDNTNHFEQPSS